MNAQLLIGVTAATDDAVNSKGIVVEIPLSGSTQLGQVDGSSASASFASLIDDVTTPFPGILGSDNYVNTDGGKTSVIIKIAIEYDCINPTSNQANCHGGYTVISVKSFSGSFAFREFRVETPLGLPGDQLYIYLLRSIYVHFIFLYIVLYY